MPGCPSRAVLMQYARTGELPAGRGRGLEDHINQCTACQDVLQQLLDEGKGPKSVAPRSLPPEVLQKWKAAAPALAPATIRFPGPPSKAAPLWSIGQYQVQRELDRGGMGAVFLAWDADLKRRVAIKVLLPHLGADAAHRERLLREGKKLASVDSPHVVRVHEVLKHENFNLPCLVMEHIEGGSLRDRLGANERLKVRETAELVQQVAVGLAAIHAQDLIHRDLKPSNILLHQAKDQAPVPKITDFGLAHALGDDESVTRLEAIAGTPEYMSPEQFSNPQATDARSDVYSLGVVLYEMLTGEVPFRGTPLAVAQQVLHEEPIPPRRLNEQVPADLETITLKCLAKEPGRRYAGAEELAQDLRRYLDGEPIHARPQNHWERFRRWCRRHPRAVWSAGVVALLIVVVLASAILLWQTEAQARKSRERLLASISLANGRFLCDRKEVDAGLLWLARALRFVAPEAEVTRRSIRMSLATWFQHRSNAHQRLGPVGLVTCAAFSPDGRLVVTGSDDRTARVWDVASGKLVCPPLVHPDPVIAVAFSFDGSALVTASRLQSRRWSTDGRGIGPLLEHPEGTHRVFISPDASTVVVAGGDFLVRVYDGKTADRLGQPLRHDNYVNAVAFSPKGDLLLTASEDHSARIWDRSSGKLVGAPLEHDDPVRAVAFSPDGKRAVTGTGVGMLDPRGQVRVWDAATGRPLTAPMKHQGAVVAVAFSSDGKSIVSGSWDKTVRLWRAQDGELVGAPILHRAIVTAVALSPDGSFVLTGNHDGSARLWEAATGQPISPPLEQGHRLTTVALGPTAKHVLIAGQGSGEVGEARLWDITEVEGDAERLELWAQVITHKELGDDGVVRPLSQSDWESCRRRLGKLGGPPIQ